MRGRTEHSSLRVLPLPIPVFLQARAGIEILHPLRKLGAIVGGCDPRAALRVDPVRAIARKAGRKHGRAVFQRDSEDSRLALRRQLEFVSQRVGQQVVRRCAGLVSGDTHQFRVVILDRSHHPFLLRVPPLIGDDAVAVAVGAGKQRGVSRSRARVGVVVIAIRKVGAVIEEEAEAGVAELIAVALQVVAAKLVDHDHHDQLGMAVVGRGES